MIKARPHQQQPPHPSECIYCDARFNNDRRMFQHVDANLDDGVHPNRSKVRAGDGSLRGPRRVLPHRTGGPPRHGMSFYPL